MVVAGNAAMPVNASAVTIMGRSFSPQVACLGLAILGAAGIAFLFAFDPRNLGVIPTCPFLSLTGCFCPGCGTLRALHMLLRGDIASALGCNILTVLSLPFIAYSYGAGAMRALGLKAPRPVFVHPRWIWALLAAIVAFWVLRNVPISPLTILAP